jgi:hypothetical protein
MCGRISFAVLGETRVAPEDLSTTSEKLRKALAV